MTKELILILIGAVATGILQLIVGIWDRKREAENILTAIASEVDSLCRLIRHQRYAEEIGAISDSIKNDMWNGTSYIIDIRENYFSVYEGLSTKLGMLRPTDTAKIVNFYAYCKSAIDSTRIDGPHAASGDTPESAANMVSVGVLLSAILALGDEIVLLPKITIHQVTDEANLAHVEVASSESDTS